MHPQGLPPPICPEHANADVMLLRSISGISSTTNIDSGSDKYSCIVQAKVQQNHEYKQRKDASIYNCHRSHELLWTHGRSCIHLIGDHLLAMKDIFEVLLVKI
uniref:Uncharacterized protein n=1 Tax=Oryza barthii TaxID=65489 RepID=A0A0D3F4J4_9ORYZ